MRSRSELVKALIEFSEPLSSIMNELKNYVWDSEELIILAPKHILSILMCYTESKVTESELEAWANAIEGREDIGLLESHAKALNESIYLLANPEINYQINSKLVQRLIKNLNA